MKVFTQTEIDEYISFNTEESINLDFKRGDALRLGTNDKEKEKIKKDIAKDISSFANSDGGIIVYGIEERNFKANNLFFVNGNEITKEWLEQIINSRINRRIEGLIIDPIRYNSNIQDTIFVVKIPRSLNAPHMTSDKKFYKRFNFESVEMEEYEIRNLYNRQERTKINIVPPIVTGAPRATTNNKYLDYRLKIQFNIENEGQTIEKNYKLEIRIPRLITTYSQSNELSMQVFFKYLVRVETDYAIFSIPNTSPLFQNELATMGTVELKIIKNNLSAARNFPVITKLFYTNGTVENSLSLMDHLTGPMNSTLTEEDLVN